MMEQSISALMDGELFEDEAENLLREIKNDSTLSNSWAAYHLIGDVLRHPEHIHCDVSAKVRERLREEPVILVSTVHTAKRKIRTMAISAAASLAAVGLVAWMSLKISPAPVAQIAMKENVLSPARMQIRPSSNDYLMAHQEFSSSIDMGGNVSYIRTASYSRDEAAVKNNPNEK